MLRVIKIKPAEDDWNSESYFENRVIYTAASDTIHEHECCDFRVERLSLDETSPAYVADQVVVAIGTKVSKSEAVSALRKLIEVLSR